MKRILLTAALTLALTGSLALAQNAAPQAPTDPPVAGHQHKMNPHRQAAKLTKELNLSPDQTAKLEPILADRDQKILALNANTALSPADRKQQMKAIHKDMAAQFNTVLTPDQMQQMKSMHHHGGPQQAPPPAPGV